MEQQNESKVIAENLRLKKELKDLKKELKELKKFICGEIKDEQPIFQ